MGDILHHHYSVTAKAMVFCDIVPTGVQECDKLVLYLTCLAKHVIWTERNCMKYEAKTTSSEGLISLVKAQMRICVYADFQRLPLSDFKAIWCKNVICCILNDKAASDPVAGWGPRNMKSMSPLLVAIFFMIYFYRAGGAMATLSPGSATVKLFFSELFSF